MSGNDTGKAVKDFLAEAEEIIDQLGSDLADFSDGADSGDVNPDIVNSIFRGAHSLKGLAGMFGFKEIAGLAHTLENLLDSLRLGKVTVNAAVATTLFAAVEVMGSLVRALSTGEAVDTAPVIARINACLNPDAQVAEENPLEQLGLAASVLSSLTEYEEHRLLENVRKGRSIYNIHVSLDLATFDQDLGELTALLKKEGEVISTLPSVGGNIEDAIDFDLLFGSDRGLEAVAGLVGASKAAVTLLGRQEPAAPAAPPVAATPPPLPPVKAEAVASPEAGRAPAPASAADQPVPAAPVADDSAKSISRTVRVDIGKLDELMNTVGELVLSHFSIVHMVDRLRKGGLAPYAADLNKAARNLEKKLTELQKGVMEIRMIPVGQLFEKMTRIIRKVSREQGKRLEIRLFGADTELDKQIIEDISDPMMHIIRNAIDHGIEPPEERRKAGKDEKGVVKLSSYQKGNHVVIEVEDDGRGIDLDRVRAKALERGLIASIDSVSDKEAIDLIFLPGFSTTDKVSELSGRGVGMDVVKNNITAISGMVDIETKKGSGSRVTITLPITLAIIKGLIISSVGRTYAIPITSVLESLQIDESAILTIEKKEVIQLRESTLPLLRLDRFLGIEGVHPVQDFLYIVVVGIAEKRIGLVVDDLLGQQDIVIKPIGDIFSGFKGISGAADLGDQRTILVLDVGGIVNEVTRSGA